MYLARNRRFLFEILDLPTPSRAVDQKYTCTHSHTLLFLENRNRLFFIGYHGCAQGDVFRTFLGDFVATLPQTELYPGFAGATLEVSSFYSRGSSPPYPAES